MPVPIRFRLLVGSLCTALLVGCDRDRDVDIVAPPTPRVSEFSTTSCESQIIPDEECNTPGREYYIPYYEVAADGEASGDIVPDTYTMDYDMSRVCPRYLYRDHAMIDWTDPRTRSRYRFLSRGVWSLNWVESQIFLASGQAIYDWPAFPGGWPGVNLDTGENVTVTVRSGRGICRTDNTVGIVSLYGVRISDDDTRASPTGGGSGGNEGDGDNCTTEYVVVEVSYDDGMTWHSVWEGYATVCS